MSKQRMKLSDVEAAKKYLFPRTPSTFEKSFPTVESIRVEIRPTGEGFEPFRGQSERVDMYNEKNLVPIIDCRNPRCYGGGLDLERLLRWYIVEGKRTEHEEVIPCRGYEGSPKGRRKDGPCETRFAIRIKVKYKETS